MKTTINTPITTSALILVLAMTTVTTATTSYAQQSRACPSGFQLNKRVCQAEPTIPTCEPYGFRPVTIELTEDGQCKHLVNATPECVDPNAYYEIFNDRCEINGTDDPSPNQEMSCDFYEGVGATLQEFDGYWQCIWYEYLPAFEECAAGTLNDESGLCEVKPGRRSSSAA